MQKQKRLITTLCGAALCVCLAAPARAQVELSCRLDHSRFVQYEPIIARVSIRNRASRPLVLHDSPEERNALFTFSLERSPGRTISRTDVPMFEEPVTIDPLDTVILNINLMPRFLLREQGPHSVAAQLTWQDSVQTSNRVLFDVLPGMVVERKKVSLLEESGGSRTLSLRTINRDHHEFLFLRIDDESQNVCFGSFNLGTVVRAFPPLFEVDVWDRIHVLHQSAPARYTRTIISAQGIPEDQTYFSPGNERPDLVLNRDGQVRIRGLQAYKGDPFVAPVRVPGRQRERGER